MYNHLSYSSQIRIRNLALQSIDAIGICVIIFLKIKESDFVYIVRRLGEVLCADAAVRDVAVRCQCELRMCIVACRWCRCGAAN